MDEGGAKIIAGPGRDRWPGSPNKDVETKAHEVADQTESPSAEEPSTRREEKRRAVLRLKVISAVQMAVLLYTEDEIRTMVEQAFHNIRNRNNDYS